MNSCLVYYRYISPLLAALIPWSSQGRKDANAVLKEITPLVDSEYFLTQEIHEEMLEYADDGLTRLRFQGNKLIQNLFGNRTTLKQLASRTFINSCFLGNQFGDLSSLEIVEIAYSHGLPSEVITDFQVILLKHKILNSLKETDWDLWELEEFSLYQSDDYDESDDEYW